MPLGRTTGGPPRWLGCPCGPSGKPAIDIKVGPCRQTPQKIGDRNWLAALVAPPPVASSMNPAQHQPWPTSAR